MIIFLLGELTDAHSLRTSNFDFNCSLKGFVMLPPYEIANMISFVLMHFGITRRNIKGLMKRGMTGPRMKGSRVRGGIVMNRGRSKTVNPLADIKIDHGKNLGGIVI